ncbi:ArsR/SmtB family transcription factor [Psychromicrobium lacuslunae]|uniref:ArsR family transcriptional regulator n=1 Tax=Psychromicrobium lacuslunae TaxID=1618207 RepID=A0A0D4BWK4_9MICC|nr:metalloregulator ArsR/SmtB family transcription factor [Psychromicrobium lacuslunae]AJT40847.1 ArsR family transcriptional regulator [Psychromicrobium lacuslunae]
MRTDLVSRCAALGDANRWQILELLGSQSLSASALAATLPISRQAIAKHLAILTEVGLVNSQRFGKELRYTALGAELSKLAALLEQSGQEWDRRLAAIKRIAESL